MDPTLLTVLITTISSMLTGVAAWLFSHKQRNVALAEKRMEIEEKDAQIVKLRSESSTAIMKQYQEALDDLQKRYESRFEYLKSEYEMRHEDLKADFNRKYERLMEEKDSEISALKKEVENLRRNLELWKHKYRSLKKEFK